ncbi:hypothetical protein BGZ76_005526, partial [Entomortierella beljakovae]
MNIKGHDFCSSLPKQSPIQQAILHIILIVLAVALAGITVWSFLTEKDCAYTTSEVYDKNVCKPHRLTNGDLMRQIDETSQNSTIQYLTTISGLNGEYSYADGNFTCGKMNEFRIALNADRSVGVQYHISCNFHDQANTTFDLSANTVAYGTPFSWGVELRSVRCPSSSTDRMLQSVIFDGDNDVENVIAVDIN